MTYKPSVLMVCPNPPWKIGGVEKHIGEISQICRRKHEIAITIYCSSADKNEIGFRFWNDVPVQVFKRQKSFPYWPWGFLSAIRNAAESHSFDLIHIQGTRTLEPLLTIFGNRGRIPYCITPHFHPQATNLLFSFIKNFFDPLIIKRVFVHSKKIICVSETEEKLITESFGENILSKTKIVGNGIDLSHFKRSPKKLQAPIILLYVGRIEKYKNIEIAIKTMKILGNNYVLRIIGDGPYRQALQELAISLGLNNVIFYGFINDDALREHFRDCNILLNFSKIEAFGISVLEALAAGRPAVVNNKLGLKELARKFPDAVFSFDPEKASFDEMKRTLENALAADVNVDLSDYNWDKVAAEMARIYSEIGIE